MSFIKNYANEIGFGSFFLYLELVITQASFQNIYGLLVLSGIIVFLCFFNFYGIKEFTFYTLWSITGPESRIKDINDTVVLKINKKNNIVNGVGKLDSGKTYKISGKISGQSIRLSFNGIDHEEEMAGYILLDLTPDLDNLTGSWSQKSRNSHHLIGTVKFSKDRNNLNSF